MMASPVNKDSKRIMHMIEPNTEGAEIGVWAGNTSVQFLNRGVSKLELIDPYSVEPYKQSKEYPCKIPNSTINFGSKQKHKDLNTLSYPYFLFCLLLSL